MYIIELLRLNGVSCVYHEKMPELDEEGIRYYEGCFDELILRRILLRTRRDVFFEANNRLFSMSKILQEIFPEAQFIHLHRDPREVISSALSKPWDLTWGSGRMRYRSEKLCGPRSASVLVRSCRYWNNYNARILEDLEGTDFLSLKFSDLVTGNISHLEQFLNIKLNRKKVPPVNADKMVRPEGRYPGFTHWPARHQNILYEICGDLMERLGY